MAKLLVKCEGNNSPKYDGRVWQEDLKSVISVNGQMIDPHSHRNLQVRPVDSVTIWCPGKGGKRGRSWHGIVMSDTEEASHQPLPSSSRKRKSDSQDDGGTRKKPKGMYVYYIVYPRYSTGISI